MSNSLFLGALVILVYLLPPSTFPFCKSPCPFESSQVDIQNISEFWSILESFVSPIPVPMARVSFDAHFFHHIFHIFYSAFFDKSNNPTIQQPVWRVRSSAFTFFGSFSEVMTPLRKPHWLSQFAAVLKKSQEHSGQSRNVSFQKRPNQTYQKT